MVYRDRGGDRPVDLFGSALVSTADQPEQGLAQAALEDLLSSPVIGRCPAAGAEPRRCADIRELALEDRCRRFLLFHGAFRNAGQLAASTSLMASSAARQVLRENSLRYFEGVPTTPVYMWHGTLDGLTPFDSVAEVAHRYCAGGAKLTFVPYDISEHMTTAVVGFPDAYEFIAARFRGEPAPTRC